MKNLLYIFCGSLLFIACDPDDMNFQDVDTSGIDSVYNKIDGPSTVVAGTLEDFNALPRSGSNYTWTINGVEATPTKDPNYPFQSNYIFNYFDDMERTATVVVTEETEFGLTQTIEKTVTVKPYSNSISGPESMYSGTSVDFSIGKVYKGSTYEWNLDGPAHASLSSTSGSSVSLETDPSGTEATAIISVTETPANGPPITFSQEVTLLAYCPYEFSDIAGSPAGGQVDECWTYTDPLEIVATDNPNTFRVVGLGYGWMEDYWGEEIQGDVYVDMTIDDLGIFIEIPEQDYFTTIWSGDPYDYTIKGSGVIDACNQTITFKYDLIQDGFSTAGWAASKGCGDGMWTAVFDFP